MIIIAVVAVCALLGGGYAIAHTLQKQQQEQERQQREQEQWDELARAIARDCLVDPGLSYCPQG